MNLLHIDSSILGGHSVSRDLGASVVRRLVQEHPGIDVTYYDLAEHPIAHLSGGLLAAQGVTPADRTPEQQTDVATGEKAMADFLAANILVIGAPMYNFSIPSQLKAWIDRIAVAGKTFRYTASGPQGLAGGKRVIIVSSRGGFYGRDTPQAVADHQEAYLATVFGFLGIADIEFVRAEGVAGSPENRSRAMEAAEARIRLVA